MDDRYKDILDALRQESRKNPGDWMPSPVMSNKPKLYDQFLDEDHLKIFRRTPLCLGEQNWPDKPGNVDYVWSNGLPRRAALKGGLYLITYLNKVRKLMKNKQPFILDHYRDWNIGRPCSYRIPFAGRFTEASIRHGYYANRIQFLLKQYGKDSPPDTVFEIGSGFGGLSLRIREILKPRRSILTDLPEDMVMAYYFLTRIFPSTQLIFRESEISKINKEGIFIVPPWLLPKIAMHVDLAVNTMSFQHMTEENLGYYFGMIEKFQCRYIYFVNRNHKSDPTDVIVDRYPVPSRYALRSRALYPFSDHFECFYENTSHGNS